jgi:hypothetical protein
MDYGKIPDYVTGDVAAFRAYLEANERDVVVVLCGAMLILFLLCWRALRRGRRVSKEIEDLRQSTQWLLANEEARLLRELRNGKPELPEGSRASEKHALPKA